MTAFEYSAGIPADTAPGRTPPQDLDAEQAVLGAMMMGADTVGDIADVLSTKDFYRPGNGQIFDAIMSLAGKGEPADAITVAAELAKLGLLNRLGGPAYLAGCAGKVVVAGNAGYHARIVADKAVLRRLADAGALAVQLALAGQGDPADIVDQAQQALYEVSPANRGDTAQPLAQLVAPALDELDAIRDHDSAPTGVPTGFLDLDRLTGGLRPGQMAIVAARPGMGKSTLGLDIARHAAVANDMAAVVFSLEMTKTELVTRLLSAESGVPLHALRTGTTTDAQRAKVDQTAASVYAAPLFVDDTPNPSIAHIRATCRRLKQSRGLRLVVIDYLQLMTSGKRVESRQVEVSEFSRQIKLLAKDLAVPVVALSQLNRGPESRGTDSDRPGAAPKGRPMLSDLRESGSLEQDADLVILLYREDAYKDKTDRTGEADLIVAKHRNGPTATIPVAFQGHYSRFVDMQK
jgi:replicative DNA helicase